MSGSQQPSSPNSPGKGSPMDGGSGVGESG